MFSSSAVSGKHGGGSPERHRSREGCSEEAEGNARRSEQAAAAALAQGDLGVFQLQVSMPGSAG